MNLILIKISQILLAVLSGTVFAYCVNAILFLEQINANESNTQYIYIMFFGSLLPMIVSYFCSTFIENKDIVLNSVVYLLVGICTVHLFTIQNNQYVINHYNYSVKKL